MATESIPYHHHRVAERLFRLGRQRGLHSHSVLIHGPTGAGHREIALKFGQSIFCERGEGTFGACGNCRNCHRVEKGIFPDWIWVEPDRTVKGLPNITMDAIRTLQDRLVLNPFEAQRVVACLFEAEKMKPETANSLLKLLEEPPSHALFVLVTDNRERILPTIRSRCLPVPLTYPGLAWIEKDWTERGLDPTLAKLGSYWAVMEESTVEEVIHPEMVSMRQEAIRILQLAINEGEQSVIPLLKGRKYDRESLLVLMKIWRAVLREYLYQKEGGKVQTGYFTLDQSMSASQNSLSVDGLVDLMDRIHFSVEMLQGYVNPLQVACAFLSEVSAKLPVAKSSDRSK